MFNEMKTVGKPFMLRSEVPEGIAQKEMVDLESEKWKTFQMEGQKRGSGCSL